MSLLNKVKRITHAAIEDDKAATPPKYPSLSAKILTWIGTLAIGGAAEIGVPADWYYQPVDRYMPKPREEDNRQQRIRIFADFMRVEFYSRIAWVILFVNLAALIATGVLITVIETGYSWKARHDAAKAQEQETSAVEKRMEQREPGRSREVAPQDIPPGLQRVDPSQYGHGLPAPR